MSCKEIGRYTKKPTCRICTVTEFSPKSCCCRPVNLHQHSPKQAFEEGVSGRNSFFATLTLRKIAELDSRLLWRQTLTNHLFKLFESTVIANKQAYTDNDWPLEWTNTHRKRGHERIIIRQLVAIKWSSIINASQLTSLLTFHSIFIATDLCTKMNRIWFWISREYLHWDSNFFNTFVIKYTRPEMCPMARINLNRLKSIAINHIFEHTCPLKDEYSASISNSTLPATYTPTFWL